MLNAHVGFISAKNIIVSKIALKYSSNWILPPDYIQYLRIIFSLALCTTVKFLFLKDTYMFITKYFPYAYKMD